MSASSSEPSVSFQDGWNEEQVRAFTLACIRWSSEEMASSNKYRNACAGTLELLQQMVMAGMNYNMSMNKFVRAKMEKGEVSDEFRRNILEQQSGFWTGFLVYCNDLLLTDNKLVDASDAPVSPLMATGPFRRQAPEDFKGFMLDWKLREAQAEAKKLEEMMRIPETTVTSTSQVADVPEDSVPSGDMPPPLETVAEEEVASSPGTPRPEDEVETLVQGVEGVRLQAQGEVE